MKKKDRWGCCLTCHNDTGHCVCLPTGGMGDIPISTQQEQHSQGLDPIQKSLDLIATFLETYKKLTIPEVYEKDLDTLRADFQQAITDIRTLAEGFELAHSQLKSAKSEISVLRHKIQEILDMVKS